MTHHPARVNKVTVASGNMEIKTRCNLALEAHLGSSVGLMLRDRKNGVGGIIHLLLPEPYGLISVLEPEKYASTGLPIFFQAILEAGGNPQHLEAAITGGALIGPITDDDIQLDLGGRTVEIVLQFLKSKQIPIVHAETGGYFSCTLTLDLRDLVTEVVPLGYNNPVSFQPVSPPGQQQIDKAISLVRPIPQIVFRVVRMIRSQTYNMKEVAEEIKKDQVASAKILKLCNSAFYFRHHRVESINQALNLLGEKTILQLVVSSHMELFFQSKTQGYSLCQGGLYFHALSAAFVAEKLAQFTSVISPDIAYTAGLLHDIGEVVLDQYVTEYQPMFYRLMQNNGKNIIESEKEIIGISHPETGARLAELWDLPDLIADAIAWHHDPGRNGNSNPLKHIIYIVDLILSRFQAGDVLNRQSTEPLEKSLKHLGLNRDDLPKVIQAIPWNELADVRRR